MLLIISMLVFGLSVIIPGDPARTIAGLNAPQSEVNRINVQLGLNKPLVVQYWNWLIHALHGNLGISIAENSPVASELHQRFPVTLSMAAGGLVVIILVGVPLGLLRGDSPWEHFGSRDDRLHQCRHRDSRLLAGHGDGRPVRGETPRFACDRLRVAHHVAAPMGHATCSCHGSHWAWPALPRSPASFGVHDRRARSGLHPHGGRQGPATPVDRVQARA